eukprot:scaffold175_cov177-Amphora_coffeaeformis.AAC.20
MDDFDLGLLVRGDEAKSPLGRHHLHKDGVAPKDVGCNHGPEQVHLSRPTRRKNEFYPKDSISREIFPPVIFPTNYSADEWNLRKPLQECSIRVERRGEILLVVFTYKKEGSPPALFAVCKVDPVGTGESLEHWIQPVGDSSRFFAIRVTDEKGGREAVIGLGFREREEAEDFSQCITNYQNALTRERMERANEMVHQ